MLWSQEPHYRDLDSVELFAGAMMITRNMVRNKQASISFDIEYSITEDICSSVGFAESLHGILRVRPKGSIWGAPVCSSWGFIGRKGTARTKERPSGNSSPRTKNANRMVVLTTLLFLAAYVRGCHIWLEQPVISLMRECSPLKDLGYIIISICNF